MVKIRKKTWHTIKNIMREVECESCGCKLKKCNWLRHLVAKTHTDGVENGGVGEIQVAGGWSWTDQNALLLRIDTVYKLFMTSPLWHIQAPTAGPILTPAPVALHISCRHMSFDSGVETKHVRDPGNSGSGKGGVKRFKEPTWINSWTMKWMKDLEKEFHFKKLEQFFEIFWVSKLLTFRGVRVDMVRWRHNHPTNPLSAAWHTASPAVAVAIHSHN